MVDVEEGQPNEKPQHGTANVVLLEQGEDEGAA